MSEITTWKLPNGRELPLKVPGYLDLSGTGITALPEGLSVGGDLYLEGTGITALPEGLQMGHHRRDVRTDIHEILDASPTEVPGLLFALKAGRVDGSTYEGVCCCLVGTLANLRHCYYLDLPGIKPDASRAAERFFAQIHKGDTPQNSVWAAKAAQWIEEWLAAHPQSEVTA